MTGKALDRALAILYVALMMVTFSTNSTLPKIASALVVPLAMLIFLVRADFEYVQQFRKVFFIMFAFLMVMLSISMLIWMLNVEEVRYIKSGVLKIFYQVINLSVAVCAVYIYRDRAVRLTFYGAVLINLVLIAKAFAAAGAGPAFDSIVYFFTSGGEQIGFMRNIEIHDLTYTYGLFFLYFAFMSPDAKKSRWIHSLLALFFFFSGFKRIGILAAAAATLLALVLFKISEPKRKRALLLVGALGILLAFAYVPFVRYGLFDQVMERFQVDTNTRSQVYAFFNSEYTVSPAFRGYGFDYVDRFIATIKAAGLTMNGVGISKMHNDILVQYIELGFWGFLLWLIYNFNFMISWWNKHYGIRIATFYTVCIFYAFINYSTGNTAFSYPFNLVLRIVLIGCMYNVLHPKPPGSSTITGR